MTVELEIPLNELAVLAGVLLAAGLASGILAGLLGIGGGSIVVPVLYDTFRALGVSEDVCLHLAVGTSLAIIIPTSIRSPLSHRTTRCSHRTTRCSHRARYLEAQTGGGVRNLPRIDRVQVSCESVILGTSNVSFCGRR